MRWAEWRKKTRNIDSEPHSESASGRDKLAHLARWGIRRWRVVVIVWMSLTGVGIFILLTKRNAPLSTCAYVPTREEEPFYAKAPKDIDEVFRDDVRGIHRKQNKYVAWFGIVRGITVRDTGGYDLLVEHRFFDGLTDCHMQSVALTGDGDIIAAVSTGVAPPALVLVRVYGTVVADDGIPTVSVDYLRMWPWLKFNFLPLGLQDHSNPRWAEYCTLCKTNDTQHLYEPHPKRAYYLGMLGDPVHFGENLEVVNSCHRENNDTGGEAP